MPYLLGVLLLALAGCALLPGAAPLSLSEPGAGEGEPEQPAAPSGLPDQGAAPTTSALSELPDLGAAPIPSALSGLPDLGAAPELQNEVWLQQGELLKAPLRLADLRGKVVLLDMWTFG
jgi:hypothetical protein